MKRIYLTGMSGTGKSSIIENLRRRGFLAIDTDYEDWKVFSTPDGDWILDEKKMSAFLRKMWHASVFVSGCCSNQKKFYERFDYVVLLSASIDTLLKRVSGRQSNTYGKTVGEQSQIISNFKTVQPLLEKNADIKYDTETLSIEEITDALSRLALE